MSHWSARWALLLGLGVVGGCGSQSGVSAPTAVDTQYGVQLNWDESNNADSAVSFNVFRSGAGGVEQVNASPVTTTSYLDRTVASGQTYTYNVTSVDAEGGQSAPSNTVSVAVP